MKLSMSEILKKACELKTEDEKVNWLRQHDTVPMRQLLVCMYDKARIKMLLPQDSAPPYTPSPYNEAQGQLFRDFRKFQYFVAGEYGGNLTQIKREQLFIELLETVDREDAKLLIQVVQQKPLKGLTIDVINKAYGNIIGKQEKTDGKAK